MRQLIYKMHVVNAMYYFLTNFDGTGTAVLTSKEWKLQPMCNFVTNTVYRHFRSWLSEVFFPYHEQWYHFLKTYGPRGYIGEEEGRNAKKKEAWLFQLSNNVLSDSDFGYFDNMHTTSNLQDRLSFLLKLILPLIAFLCGFCCCCCRKCCSNKTQKPESAAKKD